MSPNRRLSSETSAFGVKQTFDHAITNQCLATMESGQFQFSNENRATSSVEVLAVNRGRKFVRLFWVPSTLRPVRLFPDQ